MAEQIVGLDKLERRLKAVGGAKLGHGIMQKLAVSTVREAKLLVPRKTGNLGRSIQVLSVTDTSATVAAHANYAGFVEFGTRPHEITPNARKALRWAASASGRRLTGSPRVGADVVFATRVHHPGTRPHPFMAPAAHQAVSKAGLSDVVIEVWNGAA